MKTPVWILALAVMAGCGSNATQVVIDPQTSALKVPIRAHSVMVRDISLPAYAQASEITVRSDNGTLTQKRGEVWADEPARAMTGAMVRNLSTITSAQVSAEPWPLAGYPDVELTIWIEQMFARDDGSVSLAGYYAVRREAGRNAIRQFDIALPPASTGLADLASTYDAAWIQLAERIAHDL